MLAHLPDGRHLRLGRDAAALLAGLDGSRTREEVLVQWAVVMGEQRGLELLTRFEALGLLDLPGLPMSVSDRRVSYRKPMSLQLTLLRPERFTGSLQALGRVLTRQPVPLLYAVLLAGGAGAGLVGRGSLVRAVSEPVPLHITAILSAAVIAVSVLHEFGHAIALAHFGGRPRRMGVMLFYLAPAFFCDVSDGWRLAAPRHRALVALSGVLVNVGVAAASAIAGVLSTGDAATFWWLLTVANLLVTAFNLLPFVKLDGYLALMAMVDVPFLRQRAMADARAWLGRVFFGSACPAKRLDRAWSVPFGLCALAFPVLLVGAVLAQVLTAVLPWGAVGAVLSLVVVLLGAGCLLYGAGRFAGSAMGTRSPRAGTLRRLLGVSVLVAAVVVPLAVVQVEVSATGGYVATKGRTVLVLPEEGRARGLQPGDHVLLKSVGLFRSPVVATATVDSGPSGRATVATAALGPIKDLPGRTEGTRYPLRNISDSSGIPLSGTGCATVATGRTSLAEWLFGTYLLAPLRTLSD
ncbi:daptide biosynthesis intramembrane metalloprotease [Streptomyces kronopolitis]|uniref:daptide biosynthesis intramembrane metalloprotease n=1 Tax=Streptomyces kronopolitis TaxID=1612435 RepID=UPI0036D015B7